jgi:hypothetical protein
MEKYVPNRAITSSTANRYLVNKLLILPPLAFEGLLAGTSERLLNLQPCFSDAG